jgi:hypothetical protein
MQPRRASWVPLLGGLAIGLCLNSLHARFAPAGRGSGNVTAFSPAADAPTLRAALACGDTCRYGKPESWTPSTAQCTMAWLRLASSCPATDWPPPVSAPANLRNAYTMDGRIPVQTWYFNNTRYSGHDALESVWDSATLDAAITAANLQAMARHVMPSYGLNSAAYVAHALAKYRSAVEGKVGVVWGSERPWAEVLLARAGAAHITTFEYGRITSMHPRFATSTPPALAAMMLTHPRAWDFAFTYSSLEHSGLGRYGDPLNPWGDMEAAVQTWCMLKPGGLFFLGVPCKTAACADDELVWNAHRFYGPLRLSEMRAGYEVIETIRTDDIVPDASVIHVLRKKG